MPEKAPLLFNGKVTTLIDLLELAVLNRYDNQERSLVHHKTLQDVQAALSQYAAFEHHVRAIHSLPDCCCPALPGEE